MGQKIDKEVFDKFFKESYCTVEYETVKEEFERIASIGNDLFTGSYEARNLNRENFILYLTSDSYCDFEAAVQEAMDDLNPEILDAVMQFFPLDSYTEKPVGLMEVVAGDPAVPVIWDTYREILNRYEPEHCEIEFMERFAFYERAKKAYAVIATGETAIYANVLLKKGVVLPEETP